MPRPLIEGVTISSGSKYKKINNHFPNICLKKSKIKTNVHKPLQTIYQFWDAYVNMREDFAEYTKCTTCEIALLNCDCNCPYCGKREECECEISVLTIP